MYNGVGAGDADDRLAAGNMVLLKWGAGQTDEV